MNGARIVIPFVDLKAQYTAIKPQIDAAIGRVLENSTFTLGPEVAAFESDFALYCHTKHAIGVNSGTSALHLALLAAGIGPGDEVITTPMTFVATTAAIVYSGARPVFVDIEPVSRTIDPALIERAITPRTKAILPVHLYGHPADMDPIMEIARRRELIVIEDACQAHGAEYKGRRAGSIGDLGCFSFYPGKNLGAYGEGGAVTTGNDDTNAAIRMLRDWGCARKYHHELKGYNYRMEGMQGAILKVKLDHLDDWTEARREHAAQYRELLADSGIETPATAPWARPVHHIYGIRVRAREAMQRALQSRQIATGIHYPIPVHLTEAYADLGYTRGDFPVAEQLADEELSLPMYPELTETQIEAICRAVLESTGQSVK